jgi:hypothetical protein
VPKVVHFNDTVWFRIMPEYADRYRALIDHTQPVDAWQHTQLWNLMRVIGPHQNLGQMGGLVDAQIRLTEPVEGIGGRDADAD